jgi:hypothetical protein
LIVPGAHEAKESLVAQDLQALPDLRIDEPIVRKLVLEDGPPFENVG